jgi:hypothetical protein
MITSFRRSPAQRLRRAEILAAASGWSLWPRRRRPALLSKAAKKVLATHAGDGDGQCRAGCGAWPCDRAIGAATGGGPC